MIGANIIVTPLFISILFSGSIIVKCGSRILNVASVVLRLIRI